MAFRNLHGPCDSGQSLSGFSTRLFRGDAPLASAALVSRRCGVAVATRRCSDGLGSASYVSRGGTAADDPGRDPGSVQHSLQYAPGAVTPRVHVRAGIESET